MTTIPLFCSSNKAAVTSSGHFEAQFKTSKVCLFALITTISVGFNPGAHVLYDPTPRLSLTSLLVSFVDFQRLKDIFH